MSRLRQARKDRNLTLEAAAEQLGTDAGNLSRIERGEQIPKPAFARKIADFYGLTPLDVLYPEPDAGAA